MTDTAVMARHHISLAVSNFLNASSLLMLKQIALSDLQEDLTISNLPALCRVFLSVPFLAAICLFASGFFFLMYALARIDLSLTYPTVSASYVIVALTTMHLFNEETLLTRWQGIGIII